MVDVAFLGTMFLTGTAIIVISRQRIRSLSAAL